MTQLITIILGIVLILISFVKPIWGWIGVALINLYFIYQLWVVKQMGKNLRHISELSPDANYFLKKYCHYFAFPFASRDYTASSATMQFVGTIIAIISLIKKFYWGIVFGILNWLIMGHIACSFSPVALLKKHPQLQDVHDEILNYFAEKREQRYQKQK